MRPRFFGYLRFFTLLEVLELLEVLSILGTLGVLGLLELLGLLEVLPWLLEIRTLKHTTSSSPRLSSRPGTSSSPRTPRVLNQVLSIVAKHKIKLCDHGSKKKPHTHVIGHNLPSQSELKDVDPTREYKKREKHGFRTIHHSKPELLLTIGNCMNRSISDRNRGLA